MLCKKRVKFNKNKNFFSKTKQNQRENPPKKRSLNLMYFLCWCCLILLFIAYTHYPQTHDSTIDDYIHIMFTYNTYTQSIISIKQILKDVCLLYILSEYVVCLLFMFLKCKYGTVCVWEYTRNCERALTASKRKHMPLVLIY